MLTEILIAAWKAAERWGEPSRRAAALQHILPRPLRRLRTLQHDLQLAHSTVNVNLAGRSDLMALAKSNEPYIVTWNSAPSDVAFTLDAETAMLGFKLRPGAEGLRLERIKGIVVIVK